MAVGTYDEPLICDARSGEVLRRQHMPDHDIHLLAFSPDGSMLAVGKPGTVSGLIPAAFH